MRSKKIGTRYILSIIEVIVLVGLDQITKHLAIHYLKGKNAIEIVPGVFKLQYLENYGAAFGIFQNATWMFLMITLLLLTLFIYVYVKLPMEKRYRYLAWILVFFVAGAIGNFIDRILNSYVVDFLYFSLIDFPIFNVADIYVTCSCFIFALLVIFYYKEEDFYFLKKER